MSRILSSLASLHEDTAAAAAAGGGEAYPGMTRVPPSSLVWTTTSITSAADTFTPYPTTDSLDYGFTHIFSHRDTWIGSQLITWSIVVLIVVPLLALVIYFACDVKRLRRFPKDNSQYPSERSLIDPAATSTVNYGSVFVEPEENNMSGGKSPASFYISTSEEEDLGRFSELSDSMQDLGESSELSESMQSTSSSPQTC